VLHSPLFFVWIGWVLVIGAIAVVRSIYVRRENAERERKREERASRQVGRTAHPIRLPQRAALPPGYRQHLTPAPVLAHSAGAGSGITKPAGDPT
jgi:hypothetical protein